MWVRTLCPLSSSTRNMALGNGSTTVPSTSIASFFAKLPGFLLVDSQKWPETCPEPHWQYRGRLRERLPSRTRPHSVEMSTDAVAVGSVEIAPVTRARLSWSRTATRPARFELMVPAEDHVPADGSNRSSALAT